MRHPVDHCFDCVEYRLPMSERNSAHLMKSLQDVYVNSKQPDSRCERINTPAFKFCFSAIEMVYIQVIDRLK